MGVARSCISGSSGDPFAALRTQGKNASPVDVDRGVDVAVVLYCTALATPTFPSVRLRASLSTNRAILRGVRGVDRFQLPTGPFCLVDELLAENAPCLLENRTVEPRLRLHVPPRIVHGAGGRGGHVTDAKVLDRDQITRYAVCRPSDPNDAIEKAAFEATARDRIGEAMQREAPERLAIEIEGQVATDDESHTEANVQARTTAHEGSIVGGMTSAGKSADAAAERAVGGAISAAMDALDAKAARAESLETTTDDGDDDDDRS